MISTDGLIGLTLSPGGLNAKEVAERRARFGLNEIVEVASRPWLDLLKSTLLDPMIWLLLGAGGLFVAVGDISEAITLFVAMLPLIFMDVVLHRRTQASTASLRAHLDANVQVIRDGIETSLAATDLVPGDLVIVKGGENLSADGLFETTQDVLVDESILTGESFAVSKARPKGDIQDLIGSEEVWVDPSAVGYAGTRMLTGQACMRVIATGQRTSYGEIVRSVSRAPQERTPLQKSIAKLVGVLVVAASGLCVLLAAVRVYQGKGWLDAFVSAATLAVAAIPEEFPVVFTAFLGVGVFRLAKRGALVRRAVSVENIGRVSAICTDKTGTITNGEVQLTHFDVASGVHENELLFAGAAASDPAGGDPVDLAIHREMESREQVAARRLKVFPFTENRKREVAVAQAPGETAVAYYLKGAPEVVLSMSDLTSDERRLWLDKTSLWARQGHKILACARLSATGVGEVEPEGGFQFLGLLAFEDPPREEVADAVAYCNANRIKVVMLTGDHPETAVAIARDVGIGGGAPKFASAEERPEDFTAEALIASPQLLRDLDIVARCTPQQKLRIVEALKQDGEIVAVTGDGVNDVPALKAADIGIAMGKRGSRSAKEVSSIVLTDDNFGTLVNAVMEGQQLFRNLRASFEYLLLIHIPFVLTAALIPFLGYPILYYPSHMVWLELIIHPTALFAFQQPAVALSSSGVAGIATDAHRGTEFFSRAEWFRIVASGALMTAFLAFGYIWGLKAGNTVDHVRAFALALLSLWSVAIVVRTTRCRTVGSRLTIVATLAVGLLFIQIPLFAERLHLVPLHFADWTWAAAIVSAVSVVVAGAVLTLSGRKGFRGEGR